MKIVIEIIGICATLCILISMLKETRTIKGGIFMRSLNGIGSIIFTIYGCLLPAISTAVLNAVLIFINLYHLIKLIKEYKSAKLKDNTSVDITKASSEEKAETKN